MAAKTPLFLSLPIVTALCAALPDTVRAQGCESHHEHDTPALRDKVSRKIAWRLGSHKPEMTETIRLLSINDFHGNLDAGRLVSGRPVGSAPVLASYFAAEADEVDGKAIVVHGGDHVGASPPISALLQDEPSISFLNMLGNRHCHALLRDNPFCNVVGTLGNHEFDEGRGELLRLINGGNHAKGPFLENRWRGTTFPYINANVRVTATGRTLIQPVSIKLVGGIPVAFIGAVLKETPTVVTPTGVAGLEFLDEATEINKQSKALRKLGIKTQVVLIHQGGIQASYNGETDPAVGLSGAIIPIVENLSDDIDVVVSGHSHAFSNAFVKNKNGKSILVTQSFSAGTAFGEVDLKVDRRTWDVTAMSARIVTTWADEGPGLTPDPKVAAMVDEARAKVAPLINRLVGTAATDILRAQNAAGESPLGNLIADAQRHSMQTDFAFMNPGGIRADLNAGEITWGDLFTIQPFGNEVVKMTLTAAQVKTLLEQQWQGQPSARMLQVAGLTYTWDANLPVGSRVTEIRKDGLVLDPSASYTVAVNSFMAAGGDNFLVFRDGTSREVGPVDLDALVEYVQGRTQPVSAAIEGRITRLN